MSTEIRPRLYVYIYTYACVYRVYRVKIKPRRKKKKKKNGPLDVIIYYYIYTFFFFSCLPGVHLSNAINFIPSYYRPAASDIVYLCVHISQQNRNHERHYVIYCTTLRCVYTCTYYATLSASTWYIIFFFIIIIRHFNAI